MKTIGIYDKLCDSKEVYIEPRAGSSKDFDRLIKRYYATVTRIVQNPPRATKLTGAIFFAVFRGKVSEGLDFVDENARAVICIGIPYPSVRDEKILLKREYNDTHGTTSNPDGINLLSGGQWYEKQAFRAINQALGRCIRHKDDWGAIILLESRFHQSRNIEQLSKWMRPCISPFNNYINV